MPDGQAQNNEESELEKLRAQANEYLNGWKRAKADFANYERQVERDRAEWAMFSSAACVKAMLPVLDSLESAIPSPSPLPQGEGGRRSGEGVVAGIQRIRDQMLDVLKQMGVDKIKSVGEPVNTEFHEVVATEKSEVHAPGIIVHEAQRGYTMHSKVLRVAKVIVSE